MPPFQQQKDPLRIALWNVFTKTLFKKTKQNTIYTHTVYSDSGRYHEMMSPFTWESTTRIATVVRNPRKTSRKTARHDRIVQWRSVAARAALEEVGEPFPRNALDLWPPLRRLKAFRAVCSSHVTEGGFVSLASDHGEFHKPVAPEGQEVKWTSCEDLYLGCHE